MFTVGEFSRVAQVSKRLLRYYDEIDLLKPVHTDDFTGYRYYSAEQLPELNRILALKELGLSLDQIRRMLRENVSTDELQGMLLLKKAEIEQHLQEEIQRLRSIESRLAFIRGTEQGDALDVVIKQIPALPVLSTRTLVDTPAAAFEYLGQMVSRLPERSAYGLYFAVWYDDGLDEAAVDVEVGRMLNVSTHAPVTLRGGAALEFHQLPPVEHMATYVLRGSPDNAHLAYGAIGAWAEANAYRLAGPPREVALQIPQRADQSDAVIEIQYPVEPLTPA